MARTKRRLPPRNKDGSFRKRRSAASSRRRAPRRKRNYTSTAPVTNRKRRTPYRRRNTHTAVANAPRRRYRRRNKYLGNPRLLGFQLPNLRDSIAAGVGLIAPPVLESYVAPYLPSVLTGNIAGRWLTRLAMVVASGVIVRRAVGTREGSMVLVGGGAYLLTTAVQEFFPGMVPGLGFQPLLGAYPSYRSIPAAGEAEMYTSETYDVPNRLQPQSRE